MDAYFNNTVHMNAKFGNAVEVYPQLLSKTVTENGTYNASDEGAYGYDQVTVSVIASPDLPASIEICKLPDVLEYNDDATDEDIDLTGIVVGAYREDGSLWTNEDYPTGRIPANELNPELKRILQTINFIEDMTSSGVESFDIVGGYGTISVEGTTVPVFEQIEKCINVNQNTDYIIHFSLDTAVFTPYDARSLYAYVLSALPTRGTFIFNQTNKIISSVEILGEGDYSLIFNSGNCDKVYFELPISDLPDGHSLEIKIDGCTISKQILYQINISWERPDGEKLEDYYNINPGDVQTQITLPSATLGDENFYAASDEGKVVDNGVLVAQTSVTITENGIYDTTLNNEIEVDVQAETVLVSKTITQNGTYDPMDDNADGYDEVTVNVSGATNILSGTNVPISSIGNDGDIYLLCIDKISNVRMVIYEVRGGYGSDTQVSEVQLLDENDNVIAWGNGTATSNANVYNQYQKAEKAFDGITNDKWYTNSKSSFQSPLWIDFEFDTPQAFSDVKKWSWYTGDDNNNRDPITFDFMAKILSSNSYIIIDSVTNRTITTARNALAYTGNININKDSIFAAYCKVNGSWQELIGTNIDDVNTGD